MLLLYVVCTGAWPTVAVESAQGTVLCSGILLTLNAKLGAVAGHQTWHPPGRMRWMAVGLPGWPFVYLAMQLVVATYNKKSNNNNWQQVLAAVPNGQPYVTALTLGRRCRDNLISL